MVKKIQDRDRQLKELHKKLKDQNLMLEELVRQRSEELELTQDVTIDSLATLSEIRDNETGYHIHRTKCYIRILAEHLKNHPKFSNYLNDTNIELILKSAPLHDIGKVGIPDSILLKPGKLTKEEFKIMKMHTVYGKNSIIKSEKIIGSSSFLRFAKEIIYSHHEKWDGTGYPKGLKGEEIPISARLMAIADVYDALISKRTYKEAFSHEKAVHIIIKGDGRTLPQHFDPDVLEDFYKLNDEFRKVYMEYSEG